jgi:molybdenum cofactor cytidylyltransferase
MGNRGGFAAVILAAGEATRMGSPKPALPFASSTMVGEVIAAATAAGLSPVSVVTGFHQSPVDAAVGSSARVVHNPDPGRGNMSSLLAGMDSVGPVDGLVLLLADMPEVQSVVIAALAEGMIDSDRRVGWVEYGNGTGHPIALANATFREVRSLTGPKALWRFLARTGQEDVFVVKVDSSRPEDINTPGDYDRVVERYTGT